MATEPAIIDLSDARVKLNAIAAIQHAEGIHEWHLKRSRRGRSLKANAYYWGVVIPRVTAGLMNAWGETLEPDEVHDLLKRKFASRSVVNRATGELKGRVSGSTAAMDTAAFAEYLDKIVLFAAHYLNTEIPPPMPADIRQMKVA